MKINEKFLFTGNDDKIIWVGYLKKNDCVEEFQGHHDGITTLELADGLLYSGSFDHSLKSWDLIEMEHRIRERNRMEREDLLSRKLRAYDKVMEKKKGKKGGAKKGAKKSASKSPDGKKEEKKKSSGGAKKKKSVSPPKKSAKK